MVADGASPNRKFFQIHLAENYENVKDTTVHWTWNIWCSTRKLYFFCDVPHLIKTTRNNLENSHWNQHSRNLMVILICSANQEWQKQGGMPRAMVLGDAQDHYKVDNQIEDQFITWPQIMNVYEWDLGMFHDAVGLRLGHKLRDEHIHLTPQSRMRVNLAAQVLSQTVVHMLEEQGKAETRCLQKFINLIDTFFDCLNVSRQFNKTRKPALDVYKTHLDKRFEWLNKTFLKFLNEWEQASQNVKNLSIKEKAKLCLSKQTLEGFRITVHSFTELGSALLQEEGVEYLLSEKFSQDPIEEYFSKQRRRGGGNENPCLEEFNRNFLGLNIAGDNLIRALNGNYRGRFQEDLKIDVTDTIHLPKKKPRKY
ncbi:uncharacterized protein LOC136082472 isoform X1 [Hydra vulgaris]|uniref:Uncharacterized protein LOC136082472 isoform X1 n=1 Tax=Hydra vulgaris TaxID=6087 RepID=A0ABM4C8G9_HYDVU